MTAEARSGRRGAARRLSPRAGRVRAPPLVHVDHSDSSPRRVGKGLNVLKPRGGVVAEPRLLLRQCGPVVGLVIVRQSSSPEVHFVPTVPGRTYTFFVLTFAEG